MNENPHQTPADERDAADSTRHPRRRRTRQRCGERNYGQGGYSG